MGCFSAVPFPTALRGFALAFGPQDNTHNPPAGLSWNWITLGSNLSSSIYYQMTSLLETLFLHLQTGSSPHGAPTWWVPGVQDTHSPRRASGTRQVLTDRRLPGPSGAGSWNWLLNSQKGVPRNLPISPPSACPNAAPHPFHPAPGSLPDLCQPQVLAPRCQSRADMPSFSCLQAR